MVESNGHRFICFQMNAMMKLKDISIHPGAGAHSQSRTELILEEGDCSIEAAIRSRQLRKLRQGKERKYGLGLDSEARKLPALDIREAACIFRATFVVNLIFCECL